MPALSHFHMLGNLVKFSFLRSRKLTFSLCGFMQKDNCTMGNELAEILVGVPRPAYLKNEAELFQFRKIVKSPKFKCTSSQRFFFGSFGFLSPQNTILPNSNSRQISTSLRKHPFLLALRPWGRFGLDFYKKGEDFFRLFHQTS